MSVHIFATSWLITSCQLTRMIHSFITSRSIFVKILLLLDKTVKSPHPNHSYIIRRSLPIGHIDENGGYFMFMLQQPMRISLMN